MKSSSVVTLALALLSTTFGHAANNGTFTTYTTVWNGLTRTYSVYVPDSVLSNPAMVFCLHETIPDTTGTKMPIHWCTGWKTYADQYGYILVAPVSTWNQPIGKWFWDAFNLDYLFPVPPDDSGFIRDLIQTLAPVYNVNPAQVFVYGLSSGGVEVQYVLQEDVGHGCSKTWPVSINEFFPSHQKVQSN